MLDSVTNALRNSQLEIAFNNLFRSLDYPRQRRTACFFSKVVRVIFDVRIALDFGIERYNYKPAPCTLVICSDPRKMICVQHKRVRGSISERIAVLLFCGNLIGGTQLLYHRGVKPHTLFQFCGDNKSFPLKFSHLGLDISLTANREGVGGYTAAVRTKNPRYRVPKRTLTVATLTVGNNQRFHVDLAYCR